MSLVSACRFTSGVGKSAVFRRSFSRLVDPASKDATGVSANEHHSNAEELIAKSPVVEVDGTLAICDGGGGSLGHPLIYMQLNKVDMTTPVTCTYCGIRYVGKPHHH